ncbi:MAG TPA: hypothetical protein VI431_06655, partial [Candidatus Acidoferrum sp.]
DGRFAPLEIASRFPLSHSSNNKTNPYSQTQPDISRAMKTGHFNLLTTIQIRAYGGPQIAS